MTGGLVQYNITQDVFLQSIGVKIDGVVGLGAQSGVWFTNSNQSSFAFPNLNSERAQLAVGLSNMTDWTAFNPTGTPNMPTITGGFNLNYSDIIALGTPHIYANVNASELYNALFASVESFSFGINNPLNSSSFY